MLLGRIGKGFPDGGIRRPPGNIMSLTTSLRPALLDQFARFSSVGAVGFAVDLGLTLAGRELGLGVGMARVIGTSIAIAATFALNRAHTFRSSDPAILREALRYLMVSAGGGAVSFLVYAIALAALASTTPASITLAVVVGAAAALFVNFTGSRLFAFGK